MPPQNTWYGYCPYCGHEGQIQEGANVCSVCNEEFVIMEGGLERLR